MQKLWLRSTWGLNGRSSYSYSTNGTSFTPLGGTYQLGWGDYRGDRIGIFTYNNDAEAGYVDCDFFTYHYDSLATPVTSEQAQRAGAPIQAANAMMLGSWNTQVEFDDARVVFGTNFILNDSFDRQLSGWSPESGVWQMTGGVQRQTSSATPALTRFAFQNPGTNYTISVRARKLGGAEGFLMGFGARNAQDYYWLNIGGWNNTASTVLFGT